MASRTWLIPAALALVLRAPLAAAPPPPSLEREVREALERGADFLVRTQHADGAWGSHDAKETFAELGWGRKEVGGHHGVTNACTALAALALLEKPGRSPAQTEALKKGAEYLLANWKFGHEPGYQATGWGYAYMLDFLSRLSLAPEGASFRDRIRKIIPELVKALAASQRSDGGWFYYSGPWGDSAGFTTSTVLLALMNAQRAGFAVPPGVVNDAVTLVASLESPSGEFFYDSRFLKSPRGSWPLQWLGGGSRAVAGWVSLFAAGRTTSTGDLKKGLDLFVKTEDYLEVGRKRMIPHRDAPHNISGYFFFYGYYYAAESALRLPKDDQAPYWDFLARGILRTQETDGSWWDTVCYDYGNKWGTAYAMLTLDYYLKNATNGPSARSGKEKK